MEYLRSFQIENIEIGGFLFRDLQAVELKPWGLNLTERPEPLVDNMVIGRSFFAKQAVLFDYREGAVTIMSPAAAESYATASGMHALATSESKAGIIWEVETRSGPLRFVIDTGSSTSIIQQSRESVGSEIACSQILEGIDDKNCKAIAIAVLDNAAIPSIQAMVVDQDFSLVKADGIVGSDFLLHSRKLLINFSENRVYMGSE